MGERIYSNLIVLSLDSSYPLKNLAISRREYERLKRADPNQLGLSIRTTGRLLASDIRQHWILIKPIRRKAIPQVTLVIS